MISGLGMCDRNRCHRLLSSFTYDKIFRKEKEWRMTYARLFSLFLRCRHRTGICSVYPSTFCTDPTADRSIGSYFPTPGLPEELPLRNKSALHFGISSDHLRYVLLLAIYCLSGALRLIGRKSSHRRLYLVCDFLCIYDGRQKPAAV